MPELLTIDVGNTCTNFGIFENDNLSKTWSIETEKLDNWKPNRKVSALPSIISSVVPLKNQVLNKILIDPEFVSAQNIKGFGIKLKNKNEIGADRLVNVLAALELYGVPTIVIDFGTATTFDIISSGKNYLGGAIAPGIILTRDVLHERTAKLPLIKIKPPKSVIGNSTVEAMRSGLLYGYVALVEGMVVRFRHKLKQEAKVVATGGLAKLIAKYSSGIDIIDENLTLKGLNIAWQKNLTN